MSEQKISVTVNGEAKILSPGASLLTLLQDFGINPAEVVAEHNRDIVKPEAFAKRLLNDGDTVEFIRFVGGG